MEASECVWADDAESQQGGCTDCDDVVDGMLVLGSEDCVLFVFMVDLVKNIEGGMVRDTMSPIEEELMDNCEKYIVNDQFLCRGPIVQREAHVISQKKILTNS